MSDADCTPGREPRSVAASLQFNSVVGLHLPLIVNTVSQSSWMAKAEETSEYRSASATVRLSWRHVGDRSTTHARTRDSLTPFTDPGMQIFITADVV